MTFDQARQDNILQVLWQKRGDRDREQRLAALEELGILTQDADGNWRYSDAFMAWLFEES